jgi:hypothetical protein
MQPWNRRSGARPTRRGLRRATLRHGRAGAAGRRRACRPQTTAHHGPCAGACRGGGDAAQQAPHLTVRRQWTPAGPRGMSPTLRRSERGAGTPRSRRTAHPVPPWDCPRRGKSGAHIGPRTHPTPSHTPPPLSPPPPPGEDKLPSRTQKCAHCSPPGAPIAHPLHTHAPVPNAQRCSMCAQKRYGRHANAAPSAGRMRERSHACTHHPRQHRCAAPLVGAQAVATRHGRGIGARRGPVLHGAVGPPGVWVSHRVCAPRSEQQGSSGALGAGGPWVCAHHSKRGASRRPVREPEQAARVGVCGEGTSEGRVRLSFPPPPPMTRAPSLPRPPPPNALHAQRTLASPPAAHPSPRSPGGGSCTCALGDPREAHPALADDAQHHHARGGGR